MHCTNLPRPMISGCLALSPPATPIIGDSRSPLRSEWQNGGDQRLATLDFPSGPTLSRVRCIAWFAAIFPLPTSRRLRA
jgi:hypothetical protein